MNIRKTAGVGGSVRKFRSIVTVSSLWTCNSNSNMEGYKLMTMISGSNLTYSLSGGCERLTESEKEGKIAEINRNQAPFVA